MTTNFQATVVQADKDMARRYVIRAILGTVDLYSAQLHSVSNALNARSTIRTEAVNAQIKIIAKQVVLLVTSRHALPGYGDRRVWVRGPGWPDHCVRLQWRML